MLAAVCARRLASGAGLAFRRVTPPTRAVVRLYADSAKSGSGPRSPSDAKAGASKNDVGASSSQSSATGPAKPLSKDTAAAQQAKDSSAKASSDAKTGAANAGASASKPSATGTANPVSNATAAQPAKDSGAKASSGAAGAKPKAPQVSQTDDGFLGLELLRESQQAQKASAKKPKEQLVKISAQDRRKEKVKEKRVQTVLLRDPKIVGPKNKAGERVQGAYIRGLTEEDLKGLDPTARRVFDLSLASQRDLHSYARKNIVDEFRRHPTDCGSPEVQVALLTYKLEVVETHLQGVARKDLAAKRTITLLTNQRKRMLLYLRDLSLERYVKLINRLKIEPLEERYSLTFAQRLGLNEKKRKVA